MIRIVEMKRRVVLLTLFIVSGYCNIASAITLKDALQNAYLYSETVGIKEHMKDFGTINLEEAIVGFVPTLTLSWRQVRMSAAILKRQRRYFLFLHVKNRLGSAKTRSRNDISSLPTFLPSGTGNSIFCWMCSSRNTST